MIKRSLILGIVAVLLTVWQSGDVSANRYLRIGNILIETGSIVSTVTIGDIQGLHEDPFRIIKYTLDDVEVTCENPEGMIHNGLAYHGPPKKIQGASAFQLDEDFSGKRADTATSVNSVDPVSLFTSAEVCPNANWTVVDIDVFTLGFRDSINRCLKVKNDPCASFEEIDVLTGQCFLENDGSYSCPEALQTHTHNDI